VSNADAADEWDVVVPDDGEALLAELRRHGVNPGERVRVRSAVSGVYRTKAAAERAARDAVAKAGRHEAPPAFFGSVRSGRSDLAGRSEEILRADFPGR
jgi:hypothetical protein